MLDVNFIANDPFMSSDKITVYFMPGMAANPKIFENIQLDPTVFNFITFLGTFLIKMNHFNHMPVE